MDIDFKKIHELRQEIKKLIQERPCLQEFQDLIDRELEKAGNNPHNRCAVLEGMMIEKRNELISALSDLQAECKSFAEKAKDLIKEN